MDDFFKNNIRRMKQNANSQLAKISAFKSNQEVIDHYEQKHEFEQFDPYFAERFSSYKLKENPQELYKLIRLYIREFMGLIFNEMEVEEITIVYTELEDKIFGDMILNRPTNSYSNSVTISSNSVTISTRN